MVALTLLSSNKNRFPRHPPPPTTGIQLSAVCEVPWLIPAKFHESVFPTISRLPPPAFSCQLYDRYTDHTKAIRKHHIIRRNDRRSPLTRQDRLPPNTTSPTAHTMPPLPNITHHSNFFSAGPEEITAGNWATSKNRTDGQSSQL
jgi:hypothetical protein